MAKDDQPVARTAPRTGLALMSKTNPLPVQVTVDDAALVRRTWAMLRRRDLQVAALFYRRLFELDPALRGYFATDLSVQEHKLDALVERVVAALDDLTSIRPTLEALGCRHVAYGVREESYAIIGDALLWTVEQALGAAWNREVERAWEVTYSLLSQTMIQAGRDVA
jgi:hemoglobin-like flavoprotein